MLKRLIAVLLVLGFIGAGLSLALASGGTGNSRKGKYLYRKNCRVCHVENGKAKELSPISMTQAQWKTTFDARDKVPCKAEWAKMSDKDLGDIYAYLWGHAKDSPSPAKCK
ncbi:MAG: cytochrome c [Desulfarculus sp.]|nr:cytochrome c [Pseudomonadota bacterium]MBV1715747.1 cytochrome c [Desulfarculus sp.]MBU4576371.1 cytochrome c [Pseudomonadota bacterium]MBU4597284.1 cytochrome c [Pseudomonadota bacterium]MBV1739102.1 cytochrome c [Desulfarculus sp.]